MNGRIPADKVEEIRSRVDIVSLVGDYVTLKKAGRNYLGLCPFHQEKTPSFTVNPVKQMFYCFGCGEGGNAVTFLMKASNMSFPEALRYLAGKTGVVIPERQMTAEEKKELSERERQLRVMQLATDHFAANLNSSAGLEARDYLKKRGLTADVAKEFRLGYAVDNWHALKSFLDARKVPAKLAEQVGLTIEKEGERGTFFDRFRGRLIFPIEDLGGRVIAFGGRIIGKGEPKYLNSPETPLYVKGRNLYGLNKAKDSVREKGYLVLVEGYMDPISLWASGVTNVAAT
ncbi:MAG: DNA primase, partial [Smithellaceae bacterium]|nr:DNA primase [Smithellaceae bacterium]